jgi:transposase
VALGLEVSPDTLLNRLRRVATQSQTELPVKILGVDDFALRRGQRYGTILVDLEQHRPIDLLGDREAGSLEAWIKAHPEVEIITRDRAGAYADGARRGAPQSQQVADRWHLLKNITEAAEEILRVVPDTPSEYMRSRAERERRQRLHAAGKAHYDQVRDLRREGFTIVQIGKHLGWSYSRVARFHHADEYPAFRRSKGKSCLDQYDAYLRERWAADCHCAGQLCRELRAQGYRGSDLTVRRHVQLWRKEAQKTLPPVSSQPQAPAPRACVWLLLKENEKLTAGEQQLRKVVLEQSPAIRQGQTLVQTFLEAICGRQVDKLRAWLERAEQSGLPEFENFVKVLRRDQETVVSAASSEWGNGQTEGQVNRLKMIKRSMYGRAKFDLLKARVLCAP